MSMYLHSLVVMFLKALRAFLSADARYPYRGVGLGLLSPQEAPERAYAWSRALGRVSGDRFQEGVSRGSLMAVERSGGLSGRGMWVRGSVASGGTSGALARMLAGEARGRVALGIIKAGSRQELPGKREIDHNPLTLPAKSCSRLDRAGSQNGHVRLYRNITIYGDLSSYTMKYHLIGDKSDITDISVITGQNRQVRNVGNIRPYTSLYHQFPLWPDLGPALL